MTPKAPENKLMPCPTLTKEINEVYDQLARGEYVTTPLLGILEAARKWNCSEQGLLDNSPADLPTPQVTDEVREQEAVDHAVSVTFTKSGEEQLLIEDEVRNAFRVLSKYGIQAALRPTQTVTIARSLTAEEQEILRNAPAGSFEVIHEAQTVDRDFFNRAYFEERTRNVVFDHFNGRVSLDDCHKLAIKICVAYPTPLEKKGGA